MTDWKSPCVLCGYNGSGFYQPETHACMKHWTERDALLAEVRVLRKAIEKVAHALGYAWPDDDTETALGVLEELLKKQNEP